MDLWIFFTHKNRKTFPKEDYWCTDYGFNAQNLFKSQTKGKGQLRKNLRPFLTDIIN